jgi:hypothetical protein
MKLEISARARVFVLSTISIVFAYISYLLLWGLNKGFDITDEGFYLLLYQDNQEAFYSTTFFYNIIKYSLGHFFTLNILTLRIIRLVFMLITSFIISRYLVMLTVTNKNERSFLNIAFFLLSFIGLSSGYTFGPASLSYNHISVFFLFISFVLSAFAAEPGSKPYVAIIFMLIAGICTSFVFFTKFSSFFIFLFLQFLFLFISLTRERRYLLVFFVFGLVSGFGYYFIFAGNIGTFYPDFLKSIQLLQSSGYESSSIYLKLLRDFLRFILICGFSSIVVGLYFLAGRYPKTGKNDVISKIILFIGFIIVTFIFYKTGLIAYSGKYLYLFFIAFGIALIHGRNSQMKLSKNRMYGLVLFFAIPFIASFGSNNGILINSIFGIGLVLPFIWLLLKERSRELYVIIISIIITTTLDIHINYINNPYRINKLTEQTEKLYFLKDNADLMTDKKTWDLIYQLNESLKDFDLTTTPIIGIYKMPGVIYLLGGYSPGYILWNESQKDIFFLALKRTSMDITNSIVLVKDDYSPLLTKGLHDAGIKYPEEYQLKKEIVWNGKLNIYTK